MSLKLGLLASSQQQAAPLLLDAFPGAAAAYSLRKLRSAYTGPAIRVKRFVAGQEEQDFGFINGNLDTTAILNFCGGGDGRIAVWYDQSGNGIDATASNNAQKPLIVISGVLQTINSFPAILQNQSFSIGLQFLVTGYSFNLAANKLASIFSVTKATGVDTGIYYSMRRSGLADYTSGLQLIASSGASLNGIGIGKGSGGAALSDTQNQDFTFNPTTYQLSSAYFSTSFLAVYKNGLNQTLIPNSYGTMAIADWLSTGSGNHNIILGGRNYQNTNTPEVTDPTMLGKYQEFVFYFSNQTANNTGIQNNINSYYTIY